METRSKFLVILIWLLANGIPSDSHRILSDSILDIINTKHVEKLLAERRLNASRQSEDARRQFITQNDLDEEITESDPDIYHTPEVVDFEFNNAPIRRPPPPLRGDIIMQYNDTTPTSSSSSSGAAASPPSYLNNFPNLTPELMAELEAYKGDKVLKSSKSALVITRKEYLKKDWCKTEPLVQRIREEGCLTRTIINRFCYGQCNSFYIPKSPRRRRNPKSHHKRNHNNHNGDFEDEDLTGAAFKSCAFCKPKKFTWVTVTLRCPALIPQIRRKRIQRIKQCKCIAEPLN